MLPNPFFKNKKNTFQINYLENLKFRVNFHCVHKFNLKG